MGLKVVILSQRRRICAQMEHSGRSNILLPVHGCHAFF